MVVTDDAVTNAVAVLNAVAVTNVIFAIVL